MTTFDETRERPAAFAPVAFLAWLTVTWVWWAMAFAPLPLPPEWLARAREVCFGTLPNGLPDTWGWLLLIIGPLSMFGFLLAVWGRELIASARALARRPDGLILIVGLVLACGGSLAWVGARVEAARQIDLASAPSVRTEPLPEGYFRGFEPAPELGLLDQEGQRIDLAALAGRPTFVTFAFAHCATVCPVLVSTLHRASTELGGARAPSVVVVTLDPWRDTPGSLPSLMAGWGLDKVPNAHALSGEVAAVESVREGWGVTASRDEVTGEITHPGLVFVVDTQGRLAYQFLNPSAEWLVEAVTRLDREPT